MGERLRRWSWRRRSRHARGVARRLAPLILLIAALAAACASPKKAAPAQAPPSAEFPRYDDDADLRLEEEPPPDRSHAEQLVTEGRALRDQGDHAGALERFQAARTEDESFGVAHLEWAITAQYVGAALDDTRVGFDRAIALLEENPRAYYELAAFEESAGDLQAALAAYRRALALRPEHERARAGFARALMSSGDYPAARTQYARLTQQQPGSTAAWLGLARAAEQLGDLKTAESALQHVVKLYPKVSQHRRRLIAFYERTDQQKKARRAERKLDRVDPDKKRRMRRLKPSRRR